jgi:acyl-CoA reductase-like NAD-dependent aldehyde dehydrogenase
VILEPRHLIGGRRSGEGETFESRSTRDGSVLARAPIATPEVVDRAVAAARGAYEHSDWRDRRAAGRADVLLELGHRLDDNADELARLIAAEMGKPYRLALDREVRGPPTSAATSPAPRARSRAR